MPPQLKAVLFDFDDTLIDWSGVTQGWRELEAERLEKVLRFLNQRLSPTGIALERLVERYTQRTREAWMAARANLRAPKMPLILQETLNELAIAKAASLADEILQAYDWKVVPGTKVFPDVFPVLNALRSRGIRLGIVTNSSQPMFMRDVELLQHGLLAHFPDCRIAAGETGRIKPHPHIFDCALTKLGTSATETVFVGDRWGADVEGAIGVGMRAVHRDNSGPCLRIEDEWARLHTLRDLPAILDEWYPDWRDGSP